MEPDAVRFVITLVHGTFARNAPWTRPDSRLAGALCAKLGDGVHIVPFPWSGRNSPTARHQATERLRTQLDNQLATHPGARHYVIGHSHGGNIALSAAATASATDSIDGVVCMATPFLVPRTRDLGRDRTSFVVGMILVVAFGGPPVMDALLGPLHWPAIWQTATKAASLLAVLTATMLGIQVWHRHADRLRVVMWSQPFDPERTLIVRSPADEASGLLIVGQFLSQITVRVFTGAQRLLSRVEAAATRLSDRKWLLAGAALGAVAAEAILLVGAAEATAGGWPMWMQASLRVAIAAPIAVLTLDIFLLVGQPQIATVAFRLLVSALTWPVVLVLSLCLLLPFGWEVALANVLLDVTTEATPLGSWMVHTFAPPTSTDLNSDDVPLMHSVVYDNPRVVSFVCDWIASGVRRPAPLPPSPARV